ncbi:uncharacterized protein [Diadema setosum]|uniref:uncharacterized protein n=1 Tax=Diadema setosum TaxID=31175 RepID=UPI003B3B6478
MTDYTRFQDPLPEVKVPGEAPPSAVPPPTYESQQAPAGYEQPAPAAGYAPQPVPAGYAPQPQGGYGQQQAFGMQPQPQPHVYVQAPGQQMITHVTTAVIPPSDYFGLALFVTICCCLPLGIVGLVKSSEVKNRAAMGDAAGAQRASHEAHRYSMIGLGIGIGSWVIGFILIIVYVVVIASAVASAGSEISDQVDTWSDFDSILNN